LYGGHGLQNERPKAQVTKKFGLPGCWKIVPSAFHLQSAAGPKTFNLFVKFSIAESVKLIIIKHVISVSCKYIVRIFL